jgi:glyoxylase-like metal-dependent hydrolase (beta-lactamase superfamily II)
MCVVRETVPGVIRLRGAGPAGAYLVPGPEPVLVDAGMPGRGPAMLAELEELGLIPRVIVLTHGDPDHIGAAGFLRERTGARVAASAAERDLLAGRMVDGTPFVRRVLWRLLMARTPPPVVDDWLEPGDRVGSLEVMATPGHSPGHVSLRLGTTLIAGDAFDSTADRARERPGMLTHDREQARASLRMLAAAGLDAGVSGHGSPCRGVSALLSRLVESWEPTPGQPAR